MAELFGSKKGGRIGEDSKKGCRMGEKKERMSNGSIITKDVEWVNNKKGCRMGE